MERNYTNIIKHYSKIKNLQNDTNDQPSSEFIKIKVYDNTTTQLEIKKTTPFRIFKRMYGILTGIRVSEIRFRFYGQAIGDGDTPLKLNFM